jgi:D-alanyl-D-alanine carboxypeptidase
MTRDQTSKLHSSIGVAVTFPNTSLGQIAARYLAALNSGDPEQIARFLTESVSVWGLEHLPLEDFVHQCMRLHTQAGQLNLIEVLSSPDAGMIAFRVQSLHATRLVHLFMGASRSEPGRIDGVGIIPLPDPKLDEEEEWPAARLPQADAVGYIERNVARRAAQDRFSGVVLVACGEHVLLHQAYGLADKNHSVANRLDTKFNLGSMPKMFTSVAIAQLVAAGKLSYTDTLADVLPDYPNVQAAQTITIDHLLTHRAGLRGLFDQPHYDRRARYRASAAFSPVFAQQPLLFAPGTEASYSNEGYIVLGAVIERLTGQSYQDYIREQIFQPLGMRDTDNYALDEVVPNLAVGYLRDDLDDPLGIEGRRPNHMFLSWRGNACGGAYATALDLLRFVLALRNGSLLSARTLELVTSPKVNLGPTRQYGYGFNSQSYQGQEVRGHSGGGSSSGINADLEMFWNSSYTVIVLGNHDAPAAQELCGKICAFLAGQCAVGAGADRRS